MKKFYFTFGVGDTSDTGMAYSGGYVIVKAHNIKQAIQKFQKRFPHREQEQNPKLVNCSFWYTKDEWRKTTMQDGKCWEVL